MAFVHITYQHTDGKNRHIPLIIALPLPSVLIFTSHHGGRRKGEQFCLQTSTACQSLTLLAPADSMLRHACLQGAQSWAVISFFNFEN